MPIVEAEIPRVQPVPPGTVPNYDRNNPVWTLARMVEEVSLAADREHYLADSTEYLFPIGSMALYGPSGDQWQIRDPRQQDNKNDFQKQNIRELTLTGTHLVRGYAHAGDWTGAFLHLAFIPGAGSPLLGADGIYRGGSVKLFLKIGNASTGSSLLTVPYDPATHRYEIELWAGGTNLGQELGPKGQAALERGALLVRPDLVHGTLAEFQGPAFDQARDRAKLEGRGVEMWDYAPDHTLHPLRPLRLELAWANGDLTVWDSRDGANYRYEFAMSFRGWNHYLGVGQSANPHGGVGTLEYRNLYSNYFGYEMRRREDLGGNWLPELGRPLRPWNFDADGRKPPAEDREPFMAVDYMDLHILRPNCAIGIHRHRDNQEIFLMLQGKALMVTGDWEQQDHRDRAFELRTMRPGDLALIKGGGVHALINSLDENVLLFMFGGYD
jgi:mannose-6-phosphate isomerase-like protein (cupin superfamily)